MPAEQPSGPSSGPSFDQRLHAAATQLLLGPLAGVEPPSGGDRGRVSEQDGVDAVVLLLGMVHEQRQRGQLPYDVAVRMCTLLTVVRERIRPLPPPVGSPESDLLAADLAEAVESIRGAMRRPTV